LGMAELARSSSEPVATTDALARHLREEIDARGGKPADVLVNESILLGHLLCAAHEAPLREDELAFFPEGALRLVDRLVCEGMLSPGEPWRPVETREWPHRQVSIRGVSRDQYQIVEGARVVATTEPPHLYRECHPGAVYLHQGARYRVQEIDAAARLVRVRREMADARTDPVMGVSVAPVGEPLQRRTVRLGQAAVGVSIGRLVVEEEVAAYREVGEGSRAPIRKTVDPPCRFALDTVGVWLDVPESLAASEHALHAAEHALMNALPIALLCDRRDAGSTSDPAASPGGRIYVFDGYQGGIGMAEKVYHLLDDLVQAAAELLRTCRCADGCPSCVHLAGCPSGNEGLDKAGGLALLSGQRCAPPPPRVTPAPTLERARAGGRPRRERSRPDAEEGDGLHLQERLRRIGEESLRERLTALGAARAGDVLDYVGIGPVVVLEVGKERAYVQLQGSVARMWVPLAQLRPLARR